MRKNIEKYSKQISEAIKTLPYFRIEDLISMNKDTHYLKIFVYRLKKRGKIKSIKRGIYVSENYLNLAEKQGIINSYYEFLGNILYQPSYLSAEYVLQKYSILSESVNSFTLVSRKKTNRFLNDFGSFKYYHIKEDLFTGFESKNKNGFLITEATLAKALFDFLYFRKNILNSLDEIKSLRLNLENLKPADLKELKRYIKLEKSKKMLVIFNWLIELYE